MKITLTSGKIANPGGIGNFLMKLLKFLHIFRLKNYRHVSGQFSLNQKGFVLILCTVCLLSNYSHYYLRCILCSEMAATRSNPSAVKVPLNLTMPLPDSQDEESFRTITHSISPFDENSSFTDTGNKCLLMGRQK